MAAAVGVHEEVVYLGYLLPRLAKLTGRTWLSVLIVVAAWAPAAHRRAVHP